MLLQSNFLTPFSQQQPLHFKVKHTIGALSKLRHLKTPCALIIFCRPFSFRFIIVKTICNDFFNIIKSMSNKKTGLIVVLFLITLLLFVQLYGLGRNKIECVTPHTGKKYSLFGC